jgi:hypothetical protein
MGLSTFPMHFHFSTSEVLWTLTFAALLVLQVVLLGRDRARRFPLFTASIVLTALHLLSSRLLFGKMAPLTTNEIFLTLDTIGVILSLLVIVELARKALTGASRTAWIVASLFFVAIAATVLAFWGPWPAKQTIFANSTLAHLRLMQLIAEKGDLFNDLLAVELCVLLAFVGRRFHAGWRTHVQQIVLGLSTAALAQLVVGGIWQRIVNGPPPQTKEQYLRIMGLQDKLLHANSVVFLVVLVWWIVCLWIDEPGSQAKEAEVSGSMESGSEPLTPES